MAILQKRADEIRRGDVIATFHMASSTPCPAVVLKDYSAGAVLVHDAHGRVVSVMLGYATMIPMDTPDLTPAQQHAEELAEAVRLVVSAYDRGALISQRSEGTISVEFARQTFDKIKPPEPPTLAEALTSLEALTPHANGDPEVDVAIGLLDRARRAGVLK